MDKKIAFLVKSKEKVGPNIFVENLVNDTSYYDVYYIRSKGTLTYGDNAKSMWKLLALYKQYDTVVTSMFLPDIFGSLLKTLGLKHVIAFHSYLKEDLRYLYSPVRVKLYELIWLFVMRQATCYIASSQDQLNYYKNLLDRNSDEFRIIKYGISGNERRNRTRLFLGENKVVLGNIGSLSLRKGQKDILEIVVNNEDYTALIVGDGDLKDCFTSFLECNNVGHKVKLVSFTNHYYDYYVNIDIYIQSSRSEGFGLTMLEAMAYGIPIILTNIPVYNDLINLGFLSYRPGNIEELQNCIYIITSNYGKYAELSSQTYIKDHTLEGMRINYKYFLENV